MAGGRRKIFQELGLIDEPARLNPLHILGLDPSFSAELLKEDPNGSALKLVTDALYRALSKRYHPDNPSTGNAERFQQIHEAHNRITEGEKDSLHLWSKVEKSSSRDQIEQRKTERELWLTRGANLLQTGIESINHPQHCSQLQWAQGVLLQRAGYTFLGRPYGYSSDSRGLSILRGQMVGPKDISSHNPQAFDFKTFMIRNQSFGLPPKTKIATYIDEEGRASILKSDLTFIMDITEPVFKYQQRLVPDHSNAWSRSPDPLFFVTDVPEKSTKVVAPMQIVTFPNRIGPESQNMNWELPMEAVGSLADQTFFDRMKHKTIGATALAGSQALRATGPGHFNLLSTPPHALFMQDAGYSPLLTNGNALLLYDPVSETPVATNTKILGMLGSNSQAP
jgi:curved DNA-binding protein CbpA